MVKFLNAYEDQLKCLSIASNKFTTDYFNFSCLCEVIQVLDANSVRECSKAFSNEKPTFIEGMMRQKSCRYVNVGDLKYIYI